MLSVLSPWLIRIAPEWESGVWWCIWGWAEVVWFPSQSGKTYLTALLRDGFHRCKPSPTGTWKLPGRASVHSVSGQACGIRLRKGTNTFRFKTLIKRTNIHTRRAFLPCPSIQVISCRNCLPRPSHGCWFCKGFLTCVCGVKPSLNTLLYLSSHLWPTLHTL